MERDTAGRCRMVYQAAFDPGSLGELGLGFRVQGLGFRFFGACCSGFRVRGLGAPCKGGGVPKRKGCTRSAASLGRQVAKGERKGS